MVKEFYLGLFAAIVCVLTALTCAVPISKTNAHSRQDGSLVTEQPQEVTLSDDGSIRSERSTNLSHITGSARKIRMYVKNRHLQVLPDGTVNGTSDDTSDYTVLQRTTVNIGQLKIQGVATCQYLCMDSCGLLYGSKEFLDECVFNEMIEQHHYNTYSSAKYSNAKRTMYLALNRRGQPRKVQIRARQQLGKLSTYTRVLTQTVSPERVEGLVNRMLHGSSSGDPAAHPLRHHGGHLCYSSAVQQQAPSSALEDQRVAKHSIAGSGGVQLTDSPGVDRLRCRRRKKRKKKRRKCPEGDEDGSCAKKALPFDKVNKKNANNKQSNTPKCDHNMNKDECQRVAKGEIVTVKKKQIKKQKLGDKQLRVVKKNNKKQKGLKNNRRMNPLFRNVKELSVESDPDVDASVDSNRPAGSIPSTGTNSSTGSASTAGSTPAPAPDRTPTQSSRAAKVGPESVVESPQPEPEGDEDYAAQVRSTDVAATVFGFGTSTSTEEQESSTWEEISLMGMGGSSTTDVDAYDENPISVSTSPQPD